MKTVAVHNKLDHTVTVWQCTLTCTLMPALVAAVSSSPTVMPAPTRMVLLAVSVASTCAAAHTQDETARVMQLPQLLPEAVKPARESMLRCAIAGVTTHAHHWTCCMLAPSTVSLLRCKHTVLSLLWRMATSRGFELATAVRAACSWLTAAGLTGEGATGHTKVAVLWNVGREARTVTCCPAEAFV